MKKTPKSTEQSYKSLKPLKDSKHRELSKSVNASKEEPEEVKKHEPNESKLIKQVMKLKAVIREKELIISDLQRQNRTLIDQLEKNSFVIRCCTSFDDAGSHCMTFRAGLPL